LDLSLITAAQPHETAQIKADHGTRSQT
jgi:hypothetical protein